LADYVFGLLDEIPQNRHHRVSGQMEAAVSSFSQNIAEGKGRQHKKECIQFLHIAQGSLYEVVTLNEVFKRRNIFSSLALRKLESVANRSIEKLTVSSIRFAEPRADTHKPKAFTLVRSFLAASNLNPIT
jgi:four helix bundle protein